MKSFTIRKYRLSRGSINHTPSPTVCTEAYASRDVEFRIHGFDSDGRRWSITIDEQLIDQLAAMRSRRQAVPA